MAQLMNSSQKKKCKQFRQSWKVVPVPSVSIYMPIHLTTALPQCSLAPASRSFTQQHLFLNMLQSTILMKHLLCNNISYVHSILCLSPCSSCTSSVSSWSPNASQSYPSSSISAAIAFLTNATICFQGLILISSASQIHHIHSASKPMILTQSSGCSLGLFQSFGKFKFNMDFHCFNCMLFIVGHCLLCLILCLLSTILSFSPQNFVIQSKIIIQ